MVVIYMQVAAGRDLQVEESVPRETLEHVIEERHTGLCLAAPGPVELERGGHGGLARLALDLGAALGLGRCQPRDRSHSLSFASQYFAFVLHFSWY